MLPRVVENDWTLFSWSLFELTAPMFSITMNIAYSAQPLEVIEAAI